MEGIEEKLVCKARRKDNGEWVEGYYFCLHHNDGRTHLHHLLIPLEVDLSRGTPLDKIQVEIVPESITQKTQEPQTVIVDDIPKGETWFGVWFGRCPNCKQMLLKKEHKHFCGHCGQEVKWYD